MIDGEPDTERATPAGAEPARRSRARGQVAIALTVALLGFLLATQLRAQQGLTQRLQIERESDLAQILTQLQGRSDQLQQQIQDLTLRVAQASNSDTQRQFLVADARKQLDALRILLGAIPVHGTGIAMTISDPKHSVGADVLLDAIQELRDAGAEAIAVNGVRVVDRTAFTGSAGAVRIAGARVTAPYVVLAIGQPATLSQAMRIPGGVVDTIGARDGATVRISASGTIRIASVSRRAKFRYARPVPRR